MRAAGGFTVRENGSRPPPPPPPLRLNFRKIHECRCYLSTRTFIIVDAEYRAQGQISFIKGRHRGADVIIRSRKYAGACLLNFFLFQISIARQSIDKRNVSGVFALMLITNFSLSPSFPPPPSLSLSIARSLSAEAGNNNVAINISQ